MLSSTTSTHLITISTHRNPHQTEQCWDADNTVDRNSARWILHCSSSDFQTIHRNRSVTVTHTHHTHALSNRQHHSVGWHAQSVDPGSPMSSAESPAAGANSSAAVYALRQWQTAQRQCTPCGCVRAGRGQARNRQARDSV